MSHNISFATLRYRRNDSIYQNHFPADIFKKINNIKNNLFYFYFTFSTPPTSQPVCFYFLNIKIKTLFLGFYLFWFILSFFAFYGQGANSQLGPVLPTYEPSGHIFASIVQATGSVGAVPPPTAPHLAKVQFGPVRDT